MKWSEQLTLFFSETTDFTRIDYFRFFPTNLLTFDDFPLLCPDKDKTSWDCLHLHLLTPDFLKKPSLFSPNWPTNRIIKEDTFMLNKTMCYLKESESDQHLWLLETFEQTCVNEWNNSLYLSFGWISVNQLILLTVNRRSPDEKRSILEKQPVIKGE